MGHAIGDMLPLAIGAAIGLVPITAVTAMLGTEAGDGIGSQSS
jgi:hypothetical protein